MDTRPVYTCEWCGHVWGNTASATACCETTPEHDTRPHYELGYD